MSVPNVPAQQPASTPAPQIQQPQSNDEKIGSFARGFLQEIARDDDPEQLDQDVPPQEPTETEPEAPEAETPTPEPEEPIVEVELEGKKATVPEWVKHRMMADKDYRQKTMELSATKKQLEQATAIAGQLAQQAQQMAPYHAQLFQMDNHAQFLQQRLQSGELRDDPMEELRVKSDLSILLRNRDAFAQGLQQHQHQFTQQFQQLRAQQLATEVPKLFEQFPDLQKPEVRNNLTKYVLDEGLPHEAIDFLSYSAAGVKLAWKAHLYDQMMSNQAKAKEKLQEKVKTLPSATPSRAPQKGAQDQNLRKEWKKGGGKINDPSFDALLRSRLRG